MNRNIFPDTLAKIFAREYNRRHIKSLSKLNQMSECIVNISELRTKFFPQEVSSSYQLVKLTVISPFFSEEFFTPFADKNVDILLVTDFRSKLDADKISVRFPNLKCILSKKTISEHIYIVHAKIYFFEWRHAQTGQIRFILFWGSCNATLLGFEDNAEVYSWCDVSVGHPEIIGYFNKIREMSSQAKISGQIPAVNTQLNSVSLHLPALTLVENVDDFESWLESGFLWHPLEHDSFGSLKIELNKELTNPKITSPVERNGFKVNKGKNITYHYVNNSIKKEFTPEVIDNSDYLRETKKRFSVETIYGFWASDPFHSDWLKTFDSEREFILNQIVNSTTEQHQIWINSTLDLLQLAIDEMTDKKDICEHFHVFEAEIGHYVVNREKYLDCNSKGSLMNQIRDDKKLCENEYFRTAYLKGGVFAKVPKIRFSDSWEVFLDSWCENMLKEVARKGSKNLLAITLKKAKTVWNTKTEYIELLKNEIIEGVKIHLVRIPFVPVQKSNSVKSKNNGWKK